MPHKHKPEILARLDSARQFEQKALDAAGTDDDASFNGWHRAASAEMRAAADLAESPTLKRALALFLIAASDAMRTLTEMDFKTERVE